MYIGHWLNVRTIIDVFVYVSTHIHMHANMCETCRTRSFIHVETDAHARTHETLEHK